jgi:hypothetical protein
MCSWALVQRYCLWISVRWRLLQSGGYWPTFQTCLLSSSRWWRLRGTYCPIIKAIVEAVSPFETSVSIYRTTRRNAPQTDIFICEISSSRYKAQNLLGYTAVFLIGRRPTFQRCVLSPLSGRHYCFMLPKISKISLNYFIFDKTLNPIAVRRAYNFLGRMRRRCLWLERSSLKISYRILNSSLCQIHHCLLAFGLGHF